MARAAYLMDQLMSRVGLSGKSFIPLLSSFACAIPGIMAARVIENERDRLTTILVAPLMTCSARLPVYALLIAAFVPGHGLSGRIGEAAGADARGHVLLGILTAVVVALLLKRTFPRADAAVRDGVAQLQDGPRCGPCSSAWWSGAGLSPLRRDADPGGFDPDLGRRPTIRTTPGSRRRPYRPQRRGSRARLAAWPRPTRQRQALAARLADLDHQIAGDYQRQSCWAGRDAGSSRPSSPWAGTGGSAAP